MVLVDSPVGMVPEEVSTTAKLLLNAADAKVMVSLAVSIAED
jgi:hypothetical protein